jgi:hypothetical protein
MFEAPHAKPISSLTPGGRSLVELSLSDNPLGNEVAVNLAAVLSQVRRNHGVIFDKN